MATSEFTDTSDTASFEVDDYVAPMAEELPEGSLQVTFTMIPSGDDYTLYTHSVGIKDEEGFDAFMNAAAESGIIPQF